MVSRGCLLAVALAAALAAQAPRLTFEAAAECPLPSPSLAAADPAEAAWACELLAARAEPPTPDEQAALRAALRRWRGQAGPGAEAALLAVLHALFARGVEVPPRELAFVAVGRTEIARVGVVLQSCSRDGGELLERFQALEPEAGMAWEVLGGALAARGHRTFAVEAWLRCRPVLHVVVSAGPRPRAVGRPLADPRADVPVLRHGFPPPPVYQWLRDDRGLPYVGWSRATAGNRLPVHQQVAGADQGTAVAARWRWLATLAGRPDSSTFANRFQLCVPAKSLAEYPALLAAARARAESSLQALADGLAARRLVPAARLSPLPPLLVQVEDQRPPALRAAAPLPDPGPAGR